MSDVKLLYFAWVREKVGRGEETIELSNSITTVADLIQWLSQKGPEYEAAFADEAVIRVAINQQHVEHDAEIGDAKEIAFFPPVTGG